MACASGRGSRARGACGRRAGTATPPNASSGSTSHHRPSRRGSLPLGQPVGAEQHQVHADQVGEEADQDAAVARLPRRAARQRHRQQRERQRQQRRRDAGSAAARWPRGADRRAAPASAAARGSSPSRLLSSGRAGAGRCWRSASGGNRGRAPSGPSTRKPSSRRQVALAVRRRRSARRSWRW